MHFLINANLQLIANKITDKKQKSGQNVKQNEASQSKNSKKTLGGDDQLTEGALPKAGSQGGIGNAGMSEEQLMQVLPMILMALQPLLKAKNIEEFANAIEALEFDAPYKKIMLEEVNFLFKLKNLIQEMNNPEAMKDPAAAQEKLMSFMRDHRSNCKNILIKFIKLNQGKIQKTPELIAQFRQMLEAINIFTADDIEEMINEI